MRQSRLRWAVNKFITAAALLFVTLPILSNTLLAQPAEPQQSRHLPKVQARGKVLPLDRTGSFGTAPSITVDGKLDEWGQFNRRSGLIVQDLDHLAYTLPGVAKDAAGVKLLRDDKALYIGVRVIDASVYNVTTVEREYIRQDCVEVFLDVRPTTIANGSKLGDSERSDGFYQLFFVPPTPARPNSPALPARWCSAPAQAQYAPIGPVEFAGTLQPNGYDLEIRIPFTSLHNVAVSRFDDEIGFDLFVNDLDIGIDGTAKSTASHVYSWGGLTAIYYNPSRLAAASPGVANQVNNPYLRLVPARLIAPSQTFIPTALDAMDNQYSLRAAVIAPPETKVSEAAITSRLEYSATAFDMPVLGEKPVSELGPLLSRAYPSLGATVFTRNLTLLNVPGGRYTCHTTFKDAAGETAVAEEATRLYAWFRGTGTKLLLVPDNPPPMNERQGFHQGRVQVEPDNYFPTIHDAVTGKLSIQEYYLPPTELWRLSQQAELQGQELGLFYKVRVRELDEAKPVHTAELPFRAYPEQYFFPAATLGAGNFEIDASPLDRQAPLPADAEIFRKPEKVPFIVTQPRPLVAASSVTDAPNLLTKAIELGSPNRKRHPLDDVYNAPQRSIAALQLFQDRIYVGSGYDYIDHRDVPPTTDEVDVWSFSPSQAAAGKVEWEKETQVGLSQVAGFRVVGEKLYLNSIRNRWWPQTFPVHVKSEGKWDTVSQPSGWRLNDIMPFGDKLYAAAGTEAGATLLESADGGRTWEIATSASWPYTTFDALAPVAQGLFFTANLSERGAGVFSNGDFELLRINLFPGYETHRGLTPSRLQSFAKGVVYTVPAEFNQTPSRRPLFYLEDLNLGAVQIEPFVNAAVQDIKVRNSRCYVLTAKESVTASEGFTASVYSSADLKDWTRHAAVTVPALPNALEVAGKVLYIGLANRHFGYADAASGSIWVIQE